MSGQQPGPLGWNERFNDDIESIEDHLDGRQSQIHTTMPGTIVSYNPTTMTAVVQPALQVIHTQIDGTRQPTTITTISDVPVMFPGGGSHLLTFPVTAGDDCLIVFAERSIDNWFAHGGTQQPSDWRMHDINDAFVLVGTRSQPNVPGGGSSRSGTPVSATSVQLRSDDGTMVVDLNPATNKITMTAPMEIVLDTPKVTVTGVINVTNTKGGGGAVGTFTGALNATGEITAKSGGSASVTVTQHRHPANNSPPTPGT